MKNLKDFSIKTKLNLLIGSAIGLALLLACAAFGYNDIVSIRNGTVQHLTAVANLSGENIIPALNFDDAEAASGTLASLRLEPMVRYACVYDAEERPFATFQREGVKTAATFKPPAIGMMGHEFSDRQTLEIFTEIFDEGEHIGTLYIQAGMDHLVTTLKERALMALLVALVSLGVSMLLASKLQKIFSSPILQLAKTANHISREQDYTVRVQKMAEDETGSLYDAFNKMLEQIESGQNELKKAHDDLELRVQDRTRQLSNSNDKLINEIAVRKRMEDKVLDLQAQNIEAARRAGMAEIATSILHNVGNVLNSVNVSASTISGKIRKSGVSDLTKATQLIKEHRSDLGTYISDDDKGKHLPEFLMELSSHMSSEEEAILAELESLNDNIEHIKNIISLQQSHAGVSGLVEEVSLADLIEDAIRINSASIARHKIDIRHEYETIPDLKLEKHKVMQILVNLIANAKYAIIESQNSEGTMTIRLSKTEETVRLEVIDNGVGIADENMNRIFAHGFTTRQDGHGSCSKKRVSRSPWRITGSRLSILSNQKRTGKRPLN